jgi:hypothetical protein
VGCNIPNIAAKCFVLIIEVIAVSREAITDPFNRYACTLGTFELICLASPFASITISFIAFCADTGIGIIDDLAHRVDTAVTGGTGGYSPSSTSAGVFTPLHQKGLVEIVIVALIDTSAFLWQNTAISFLVVTIVANAAFNTGQPIAC